MSWRCWEELPTTLPRSWASTSYNYNRSLLDSLAVGCRFEPAVGGTSEALRVAVLPIREGKCLPGVFAPNGQ